MQPSKSPAKLLPGFLVVFVLFFLTVPLFLWTWTSKKHHWQLWACGLKLKFDLSK